jgi:hypothetical protein
VDHLIGLSSLDPYSQPTHRRAWSNAPSSPSTSTLALPSTSSRRTHSVPIPAGNGVPIPRPSSQIHRPTNNPSGGNTPLSHSPSSSDSPFPFSPVTSTNPASFVSNNTNTTTPPSSASLNPNPPAPYPASSQHTLSYPLVPPPSLSSSFGSPTVSYLPHRDPSLSPVEPLSRRGSHRRGSFDRRVPDPGNYRPYNQSHSRRESVERGARVAESGTLIPRSRASSQSLATTSEDPGFVREIGLTMDGFAGAKP